MSPDFINALIYFGIFLFVTGISILFVWLKKKFNLQSSDLNLIQMILQVVDYIASQTTIPFKDGISIFVKYAFQALDFVESYSNITDINEKKALIKEKTLAICAENNIIVNADAILLIDMIIDYIISQGISLQK